MIKKIHQLRWIFFYDWDFTKKKEKLLTYNYKKIKKTAENILIHDFYGYSIIQIPKKPAKVVVRI